MPLEYSSVSQGQAGACGVSGVSGVSGTAGSNGACGVSGTAGACGVSGTTGNTGNTGACGVSGVAGACGVSGTAGTNGTNGACGVSGVAGTNGACGVSGTAGTNGACGVSGVAGACGVSGTAGSNGACGVSGITGDIYLTTSTSSNAISIPTTSLTFTVAAGLAYTAAQSINIVYNTTNYMVAMVTSYSGTTLIATVTTSVGAGTYTSWTINLDGATGGQGACGVSGTTGACGVSGVAGACGVSGVSGVAGTNGACGISGVAGACGVGGTAGACGVSGHAGACGVSGVSGVTGVAGACGVSGISGVSGTTTPLDNAFLIENHTDTTKTLAWDISGNSTGIKGTMAAAFTTAKTLTYPNATDTLVGKATTDTFTNKTIASTTNSVSFATFTNPYKFAAYRAAALNSSSTSTAIVFDTKIFDTGTNFSTITGAFTAPVAGFYYLSAAAGNSAAFSTSMSIRLNKNGSTDILIGTVIDPSAAGTVCYVGGLVQLASSDSVTANFIGGSGSAMYVGLASCWYNGFLVSIT